MNKHLKCFLVALSTPIVLPLFLILTFFGVVFTLITMPLLFVGCIEESPLEYLTEFIFAIGDKVRDL